MLTERKLNRVNHESLKDRIYSELRYAIMTGKFRPGEVLTVKAISDQLGTGIMPVRENIHRLVAEGALVRLPNRQIRVPDIDREEFQEICNLRRKLEGYAVSLAAERATPSELKDIRESLKGLNKALKASSIEGMLEANTNFHFTIYDAAHSKHLFDFIQSLWLRFGSLLIYPLMPSNPHRKEFMANQGVHTELVEALEKHEPIKAEKAIEKMLVNALNWYEKWYEF